MGVFIHICVFFLYSSAPVLDSLTIEEIISQVKTQYENIEKYSDRTLVYQYDDNGTLSRQASMELYWDRSGDFSLCWHSHFVEFSKVYMEACLSKIAELEDSTLLCVNNSGRFFRSTRDVLGANIGRWAGSARGSMVLLKLLFGDKISTTDFLKDFVTYEAHADTVYNSRPCYRISVIHSFPEYAKNHSILEVSDKIVGEIRSKTTFWIDLQSFLVLRYERENISSSGTKSYTDTHLSPIIDVIRIHTCAQCCEERE